MRDGNTYAKPGAGTPGFRAMFWWTVSSFPYSIGLLGANACLPYLPAGWDGAGYGAALLWGGPQ